MAYNPFNIFRRNQKALFAVLTVFVMVVFTLSSGVAGGDFFETFTRWLGANKGSKEEVCKIDGHRVTAGELEGGPRSVQFKRVMANRFMYYAARQTAIALSEYATQQRERLSPMGKDMADAAQGALGAMAQLNDPQFQRFVQNFPQGNDLVRRHVQQISMAEQAVDATLESSAAKSEDKDVARAYRTVFVLSKYLQEGGGEHYFINAPNKARRDLVEFMLWEKKADQLGIRFGKEDAKKLIQNEFYNFFKSDVEVRKILQQTQGFTMDACLLALASEFKVRAAQTAVLGHDARYHRGPALAAPYEMFEFYREQTSPATYDVLAVPAAAFVDKVTGEPTEAEVNELFKKYADAEPNPKSETPGIKEPRKLAVGWLAITGDEPYYKQLAAEQIKVGEVMAKASGALAVPLPGAVGTWVAGAVAPLSIKEPAVDAAYFGYVTEFNEQHKQKNYEKSTLAPRFKFSSREADDPLLPTSVVRPGVVAATVGAFVGQTAGFGSPGSAVTLAMTAPLAYEIRDRIVTGLPLALGAIPNPALLQTAVGGIAQYRANEPKPLPIEALRPELLKNTTDKRARVLAFGEPQTSRDPEQEKLREKGDVARFIDELKKMSENDKPKDKAAVEKYIKEFVATRGLAQTGASTAPRDEWALEDDAGLKPLLDAHKSSVLQAKSMRAHGGAEPYFPFGRSFFWRSEPDMFGMGPARRSGPTAGTYLADTYPPLAREERDGQPRYVVWRTEDVAPKKLNLQTGRPAVVAAWKRLEARKLASAHANAVAEKIRNSPNTDPLLLNRLMQDLQLTIKDPKVAERARLFPISGVAPLAPRPASMMSPLPGLQQFGLSESEDIPYPTVEMVTALLDNRDKGAKTVLVLADAPKDTFYVAALMDRRLRERSEFTPDVFGQRGGARGIVNMFRDETVNKARQSVLELLKKEFKYEENEEQKKKLDENAKSGGRNTD